MLMKKKENEKINEHKEVNLPLYPDFSGEIRLCPDDYVSNSASATECTGLMQVTTDDEDVQEAYDAVYSFRAKTDKK